MLGVPGDRLLPVVGTLGLFIGCGLLRLSNFWRKVALVYLTVAGLSLSVALFRLLSMSPPPGVLLYIILFDKPTGLELRTTALVLGAIGCLASAFACLVLRRPRIRLLFQVGIRRAEGSVAARLIRSRLSPIGYIALAVMVQVYGVYIQQVHMGVRNWLDYDLVDATPPSMNTSTRVPIQPALRLPSALAEAESRSWRVCDWRDRFLVLVFRGDKYLQDASLRLDARDEPRTWLLSFVPGELLRPRNPNADSPKWGPPENYIIPVTPNALMLILPDGSQKLVRFDPEVFEEVVAALGEAHSGEELMDAVRTLEPLRKQNVPAFMQSYEYPKVAPSLTADHLLPEPDHSIDEGYKNPSGKVPESLTFLEHLVGPLSLPQESVSSDPGETR